MTSEAYMIDSVFYAALHHCHVCVCVCVCVLFAFDFFLFTSHYSFILFFLGVGRGGLVSLVSHEYATSMIHPKPVSRVEYLGEGDRPDRACSSVFAHGET